MGLLSELFNIFLHLDEHLRVILQTYGTWTYAILFLTLFVETGIVVMPFLPGDSLLFVARTFAALGLLNVWHLFALLATAAILGDTVNYAIGHAAGPRVFERDRRFLKQAHLDRTHTFYARHGGKAIVLARFVPLMRTLIPFVAGVGRMDYGRFLFYHVLGGVLWTSLCIFSGYFFGNLPLVRDNFHLLVPVIIAISVLPMVVDLLNHWRALRAQPVAL